MADIDPNIDLALDYTGGIARPERAGARVMVNAAGTNLVYYRAAGATADRPVGTAGEPLPEGLIYADSTLGSLVYWDGSAWV